jgi:hypothetical protein
VPPGLGEILAESGDLTFRRLRRASDWRRVHGGTIERALLATGAVSEETLLDALARLTGLPSVSRERLAAASPDAVAMLPPDACRRLRALPVDRRGGVLHVAVVDPSNPVLETGLIASTGCDVRLHVTADPILEDVLRSLESQPQAPGPAAEAVPPPERSPAPAVPGAARADPDPFGRLGRALLTGALDAGAEAVEIGTDGRGAILRTYAGGLARSSRPLPRTILEPLCAWLLARSRPSGPFEEGGFLLERAGRRVRVRVSVDGAGTAWLVLESEKGPRLPADGTEICLHEGAEGDVFCPACGAPL